MNPIPGTVIPNISQLVPPQKTPEQQVRELKQALKLLVAGGFVTQQKVDQALALASTI